MQTKILKNGFSLPVFGIGTWEMGGRFQRDLTNDDELDIKAIKRAIDNGITHIDTAEIYADGHSERLVAKAIQGYDREKLCIVTKVSDHHLNYDDVIRAARNSMKRLEINYIDLYLIHKPNKQIPLGETMRAMNTLVDEGIIRHIGVSNFAVETLKEAHSYSNTPIVANQVHYNLICREIEVKGLLEYCQQNDIMVIAWRPVEKGFLAQNNDIPVLKKVCQKYRKTPAQVAINWLISQPYVVTIAKTRNFAHLDENLGATGWTLEDDDIELLRQHFPGQQHISDDVPLS